MKLIKQAIVYNFYTGLNVLFLFLNNVLINKIALKEELGSWILYINSISILVLVLGFGFNGTIVFWVNKDKERSKGILSVMIFYLLFFSLLIFPIIFFLIYLNKLDLVLGSNYQNLSGILILYFSIILTLLINLLNSFLQAFSFFNRTAIISIILQSILFLVYLNTYLLKSYFNVHLLMVFNLVILFTQAIILFFLCLNYIKLSSILKYFSANQNFALLKFGSLVYFTNILQTLSYKIDFWFISSYLGINELPVYALAVLLSQSIWIISNSISSIIYTKTSNFEFTSIYNLKIYIKYNLISVSIIAIFLFYFCKYFLVEFLGKDFIILTDIMKVLYIGIIPFSITNIICGYLSGKGLFKLNFYTSFVGFIFGFISYIIFIPYFGLIGAAWGSVISYLSSTIFIIYITVLSSNYKLN